MVYPLKNVLCQKNSNSAITKVLRKISNAQRLPSILVNHLILFPFHTPVTPSSNLFRCNIHQMKLTLRRSTECESLKNCQEMAL